MAPAAAYDWLFLAVGWTVAGLATLLLIWALFWDRPRGRRRCPKCWYDMAGVPTLQCPECGRMAPRETRLFKTRRRPRWATAATVLRGDPIPAGPLYLDFPFGLHRPVAWAGTIVLPVENLGAASPAARPSP